MNINLHQEKPLDLLTDDIVFEVTKYLDTQSIKNLSETSKRLHCLFDQMLSSSPKATNKIIKFAFQGKTQSDFFKLFSKTYHLTTSLLIRDTIFCSTLEVNDKTISDISIRFPNVVRLDLRHTNIDDKALEMMVKVFPKIEALDFVACKNLTTVGLSQSLPSCKSLKSIFFGGKTLEDRILGVLLEANPHLDTLGLFVCDNLTNTELARFFSSCKSLKETYLSLKQIDDKILQALVEANPQLVKLSIYECDQITKEGLLKSLSLCKFLKEIDLGRTNIDDETLVALIRANPGLEVLCLNSCYDLSKEGFLRSLGLTTSLKSINLNVANIDDEGLFALTYANAGLEELIVSKCTKITQQGLRQSLALCKSLMLIDLSYSTIGDEELLVLIRTNPQLRELNLSSCKEITKKGLVESLTLCKSLKLIDLSYSTIGDEELFAIIAANSQVENLKLRHCKQITKEGVLRSLLPCKFLKSVSFSIFFDSQALEEIKKTLQKTFVLVY